MNTQPNNTLKQIIHKARSVPLTAYLLILINAIMFTSFLCHQLPVPYLVGMILFTVLLVTAFGKLTNFWSVPNQLIGESFEKRVKQIEEKIMLFSKRLDASQLKSNSINTIIALLLIIYISSILNGTFEIFIITNIVYCFLFLPTQTQQCLSCCSNFFQQITSKISYNK